MDIRQKYLRDRKDPEKIKEAIGAFLLHPNIPEAQKEFLKNIFWNSQDRSTKILRPTTEQIAAKLVHIGKIYDLFTDPSNSACDGPKEFFFSHLSALFNLPESELAIMANDPYDINNYLDDCEAFLDHLLRGRVQLPPFARPAGSNNVIRPPLSQSHIDYDVFQRDRHHCIFTYKHDALRAYPIIPYGVNADTDALVALKHRWPRVEQLVGRETAQALMFPLRQDNSELRRCWNHITVSQGLADMLDKCALGLEPLDDEVLDGLESIYYRDKRNVRVRVHWLDTLQSARNAEPFFVNPLQRPEGYHIDAMFKPLEYKDNVAPQREVNVRTGQLVLPGNVYEIHDPRNRDWMVAALKLRWQLQMVLFCAHQSGELR